MSRAGRILRRLRWPAAIIVGLLLLAVYLSDEIYLRPAHEPWPASGFDRRLPVAALRDDIAALVATFDRNHPALDAVGGAAYREAALSLAARIDQPLTRIEFYRLLAGLNGHLRDGHSYLRMPTEEWQAYLAGDGRLFPLEVEFAGERVRVRQVLTENGFAAGDELERINGVAVASLTRSALAAQSGESAALRTAYAEATFHRQLWAEGLESPFEVEFLRAGRSELLRVAGLSQEARRRALQQDAGYGRLEFIDPQHAVLYLDSLPTPSAAFERWLAESFERLARADVSTLILDLRRNGGGDSRSGDLLLSWLSAFEYPAIERVDVKVTADIKDYYRTLLPRGFRWIPLHWMVPVLRQIDRTAPGASFTLRPGPREPVPRSPAQPDTFGGALCVLIGPRTFSSAVILAAPLKYFGRARFLGGETGGPTIFYGENYVFDLPNSHLQAQVSHKRFHLVGGAPGVGIVPDRQVDWPAQLGPEQISELDCSPR